MGEDPLGNDESAWKDPVTEQLMYAVNWRSSIGVDIPVITTEWGCWLFSSRLASDVEKWMAHNLDLMNSYNIGNLWYTGMQHNQRAFAIFNAETGWSQVVLTNLTGGVAPTT